MNRPDIEWTLVIIPTYNEVENIARVLERLHAAAPVVHALIVDDSSPDGTGLLAEQLAAEHDWVHVLHRPGKEGLGAAYLAGFAWGLKRGYDALVEMDADLSHHPEDVPRLLAALGGADVVLGSRWVPGGAVERWPLRRKVLSRGGNVYARLALGLPLRDATGGFRAYRREALLALDPGSISSSGYCFQVELAFRAVRGGMQVLEIPITFTERELGVSKMSKDIVLESVMRLSVWGMRERGRQARALLGGRRAQPVLPVPGTAGRRVQRPRPALTLGSSVPPRS